MPPEYWEHWVRILTFLGSLVLFVGSYRGQRWSKIQARVADQASKRRIAEKISNEGTDAHSTYQSEAFDRAAEHFAGQPYFDRRPYVYLCVGFAITSAASLIDIISHRSVQSLFRFHN